VARRTAATPAVLFALFSVAVESQSPPVSPVARQAPTMLEIHGRTLVDPYAWMDNASDPDLLAYVEAENRYALAIMKPTEPLQQTLSDEMAARVDEADPQPPQFRGRDAYYVRHAPGQQYQLLCRRRGGLEGREDVLVDLNTLAGGGRKPAFGVWRISPDSTSVALSVDSDGSESFTIHVVSLVGSRRTIAEFTGTGRWLEWGGDSRTLFHTTPYGQGPARLMRRRVGDGATLPKEIYAETAFGSNLGLMTTRTGKHLVAITYGTEWEIRVLRADDLSGNFQVVAPRRMGVRYWISEAAGAFYLLENTAGAASKISRAPTVLKREPQWEEVLPRRRGWIISDFEVAAGMLIAAVRDDGSGRVRVLDMGSGVESRVPFPDEVGQVRFVSGFERDQRLRRPGTDNLVQFLFESLTQSRAVYEYDAATRRLHASWRAPVRRYQPGAYESRRVTATSPDGEQIPISLVYRKPLTLDGSRPLLLSGFGFVGMSADLSFDRDRLSLLDRGVIYGVAHVRGGGEFGLAWHQAATGLNKMRTFTDFIACAEHLTREGFTSPARLAITGTSAGGMLVTAVANMRPSLMRAVIAKVPATNLFHRQPGSTALRDNAELGDPNKEPDFSAMLAYTPYYNVKPQAYPHMLVTASRLDPRVDFQGPVKFAARLRAHNTGDHMILLRTDLAGGGHTGSPGLADRRRDTAFEYAFLLRALGVEK
jgi:oligopeptidase B